MTVKVLKFGGSSVGDAVRIRAVIAIIQRSKTTSSVPLVVVSAQQGVTDELIRGAHEAVKGGESFRQITEKLRRRHQSTAAELLSGEDSSADRAHELSQTIDAICDELDARLLGVSLLRELSLRTLDAVMSVGERLSAQILTAALNAEGVPARYADARELMVTDATFGNALVDEEESYQRIRDFVAQDPSIAVMTGFLGATPSGETTTLGRGGSDYTASLAGAALEASQIEIWTDVSGVLTCDPRKVRRAFPLPYLSYEEAMELSHFGAKVIYPPTMRPAMARGIPLIIKNSFEPAAPGTVIGSSPGDAAQAVRGISSIDQLTLIRVQGTGMIGVSGMAMRLFRALAQSQVNVILITQASSEHTICVAVKPSQSSDADAAIREEFSYELRAALIDPPIVDNEYAIVSVVGDGMRNTPGVAATLCHSLAENGVNIAAIAQGSSERNISVVIRRLDQRKALNAIHDRFFLSHLRALNIFVVGHGLIGRTLLDQIQEYRESLHRDHHVELTIVGLTNSSRMIIDEEGISLANAEELLNSVGTPADLQAFVHRMIQLNLPHSVFVDCTASAEVPHWYHTILSRHIAVVTPNKKGQSGPLSAYKLIKDAAKLPGSRFLFETSVGAGLPVIGTLNDLLRSGDSIRTIDAVLSGTLSYLFNTLVPGRPMSELIRDARDKGYTEPDPRDDLSGLDVARKLLILAREAGFELELGDIEIENLVPEPLRDLRSAEAFLAALPDYDKVFEKLVSNAHEEGKRLRYIAQFNGSRASVSLKAVDRSHPFFSLSGSDNIIAFTTERYHSSPLVIQGPGAGAAVTAAGVFADIVRVALAS